MSELIAIETLVLELLLIVSVVSIIVRRFRIPYTVALVLAGLVLSIRSRLEIDLTPELILFLLLPPLVFEAAFHLNFDKLRRNLTTIGILAIPGVVMTMLVVGGILNFGIGLPLPLAMVFGALIAATDPVSVVAIFRQLGAPKRLEVMLEGESLFNDGTAIVIFGLALEVMRLGEFNLLEGIVDFLRVGGGGFLIGLVGGWVVSRLIGEIDDYLVETTLTTVLAFGSYLIAEQFHFSGVLAVVVAGLVCGDTTEHEMSPTTRIVVFNFWEYVAFLANSAVFLLIGLDIDVPALVDNWRAILWGIGAVLVARAIGVYGLSRLGRSMPWRWRHIMFWGGLRGAIALALALSLPFSWGEERRLLVVMTFGVVLFTLLVQGLTMEPLLRRLGLISRSDEQVEYERRQARVIAVRAGFDHLKRMHRDGLLSAHTWERLQPILQGRVDALAASVREALNQAPDLEVDEIITARREAFRAQRNMLANLRRDGVISEETYEQLVAEVDVALDSTTETMSLQMLESGILTDVQHLMFVIIQARDLEAASNALAVRNIHSTIIQAYGSFLGKTRYMLLVGVRQGKLLEAVDALHNSCRQRVEFPAQVGDLPLSLDPDVSFQVHGATVLALDVERFEVIP